MRRSSSLLTAGLRRSSIFFASLRRRVNESKSMQKELIQLMRTLFGHTMVRTP
jgi:chromosome partitioning protein